jgi:hypothetical protein
MGHSFQQFAHAEATSHRGNPGSMLKKGDAAPADDVER